MRKIIITRTWEIDVEDLLEDWDEDDATLARKGEPEAIESLKNHAYEVSDIDFPDFEEIEYE